MSQVVSDVIGGGDVLMKKGAVAAIDLSPWPALQQFQARVAARPRVHATLVAEGLARRLNFVTTYLADLKEQYGDAPGLSMVSDVLSTLSHHGQTAARPGSARDPDPDY